MTGDFTFLKGNIEPIILNSLYSGDKYGYEIAKEIKEKTANNYEIKQPTLYSYLKKLESQGLITSYWGAESNGGRRRYYALTDSGRANFEQYYSQWQHQRNVMDTLVDTAVEADINQVPVDTTIMLGTKRKKQPKKRTVAVEDIDNQYVIAEQLAQIDGSTTATQQQSSNTVQQTVIEQAPAVAVENTVTQPTTTTTTDPARFDIHQDSADVFMQDFEQRASVLSTSDTLPSDSDYQDVLLNIVGGQLDEMQNFATSAPSASDVSYSNDRPIALEEVADDYAKLGIRMRIYNRTTALFHSKKLVPASRIVCLTAWFSYIATAILLGIMALVTYNIGTASTILIVTASFAVIPIALTIRMFADPTRKPLKKLNYKLLILSVALSWVGVVMLTLAINVLFINIKFSNLADVVLNIILPSIVCLAPLLAVSILPAVTKKYT